MTRLPDFSLGSTIQIVDKIVTDDKHIIMAAPVYDWDIYDYVEPFIKTYLYDFTPVTILDIMPTSRVTDIAVCDGYLAMACIDTFLLYQRSGDNYIKIASPHSIGCENVAFSPDGLYMAVGDYSAITIYKLTGGVYTQIDTEILSTMDILDLELSNNYLVAALDNGLNVYKRTNDSFNLVTSLDTTMINSVSFSPDEMYLACAKMEEPCFDIYKRVNDTFTKIEGISIASDGFSCAFSQDGLLAVTEYNNITIFQRTGDVFTILESVPITGDYCLTVTFNSDGMFAGVSNASSYIVIYQQQSGLPVYVITDIGLKQAEKMCLISNTGLKDLTQLLAKE